MSINYSTLAHFRHFSSLFTHFRSTTVENSLQITPFYAKQSQFPKTMINVNSYMKREYENSGTCWTGKTKPIQSQFKPKQTQFNPIQSQNKANSNPISNDINGLDNNRSNCYISFLSFYVDKLLK